MYLVTYKTSIKTRYYRLSRGGINDSITLFYVYLRQRRVPYQISSFRGCASISPRRGNRPAMEYLSDCLSRDSAEENKKKQYHSSSPDSPSPLSVSIILARPPVSLCPVDAVYVPSFSAHISRSYRYPKKTITVLSPCPRILRH